MNVKIGKIFSFSGYVLTKDKNLKEINYQLEVICKLYSYNELPNIDSIVLSMLDELLSKKLIFDVVNGSSQADILSWIYYKLVDKLIIENLRLWIDDTTYIEW